MADSEITLENLPKLKVAELKKACKDQGLPVSGTKAELLTRLQESLQLQVTEEDGQVDEGDDSEQDINLEDTLEGEASIEEDSKDDISTEPPIKKIVLDRGDSNEIKPTEAKIDLSKGLTDEERLQKRAAKFGVQSEEAKKKSRAERFGIVDKSSGGGGKIASTPVVAEDLEKLKQRAERFGAVVSNQLSKLDEEEKIAKRKERFGAVLSTTTNKNNKISVNTTLSPAEQEKKRKRAERFGLTT